MRESRTRRLVAGRAWSMDGLFSFKGNAGN
ncbi:hypothetical protein LINPERPRIM_LOCUS30296 [Linum perenne]